MGVAYPFPGTSSSISSSDIYNGLTLSNVGVNYSASSWIGKVYYTPGYGSTLTVGSSPNWNQFRGNFALYVPDPPPDNSCFLAGTPVNMSDGSIKSIEDVVPGDLVIGAFGEINEVLALDWVVLGDRWLYNINNEHMTSDDHPHISTDKKFYSCEPDAIYAEWGNRYEVITSIGKQTWLNVGLKDHKVTSLNLGIELQTIDGPKTVTSIEKVTLPAGIGKMLTTDVFN